MKRGALLMVGMAAALVLASSCTDELPTSTDPDHFPISPTSVELLLPFEAFGRDLQVIGGFGSSGQISRPVVAREFGGELDSHVLVRFQDYPESIMVEDPGGESVPDSAFVPVGGRIELRFDTLDVRGEGPFLYSLGATLTAWHPTSTTWELAVDTLGVQEEWPEPGAGPVLDAGTLVWDPADGDTVSVEVDSAVVAAWKEPGDFSRGLRIQALSPGTRTHLRGASLDVDLRPSVNPDTVLTREVGLQNWAFVFQPQPDPGDDRLLVGGTPAWRTVFRVEIPDRIEEPMEACQEIQCPVELRGGDVVFAALVLEGRTTPPGFQPADSIPLDVRTVLRPDLLPRSPLGRIQGRSDMALQPHLFQSNGETVEVPLTLYVRNVLDSRRDPDREGPPSTLALLSTVEPFSMDFATFAGPGEPGEPRLRLFVTLTEGVQLP